MNLVIPLYSQTLITRLNGDMVQRTGIDMMDHKIEKIDRIYRLYTLYVLVT